MFSLNYLFIYTCHKDFRNSITIFISIPNLKHLIAINLTWTYTSFIFLFFIFCQFRYLIQISFFQCIQRFKIWRTL